VKQRTGRIGTNEDTLNGQPVVQSRPPKELTEDRDSRHGTGETYRSLSWIWTTSLPIDINDGADNDDRVLRVEWCKSRARAKRSIEEFRRVKEEMRRTLMYLEWKSNWWTDRARARKGCSPALLEGLQAYSEEQADLQLSLRDSFTKLWGTRLEQPVEPPKPPPSDQGNSTDDDVDDEDSDREYGDEPESDDED
jgi:hypothetical protein